MTSWAAGRESSKRIRRDLMRVMPGARVGTLPTTLVSMLALLAALLVSAIALAPRADAFVYWANPAPDAMAIGRANLDGTDVEEGFIPATDGPVLDVSVDATHVYWTKGRHLMSPGVIRRADLDGTGIDYDFITDVREPQGIAVDAAHVYWTEGSVYPDDSPPTIGRANLDGTGVDQAFIAPERRHAVAVAVNFSLGKLRRNRNRGTAKLTVEVPAPGDVALAQTKKLKGSELRADAAEKVRLPIKPRGKAKQQLAEKGKAMVRADVTYSPDGGEPTTQSKEIKLI